MTSFSHPVWFFVCILFLQKATKLNPLDWEAWHSLGAWYVSYLQYKLSTVMYVGEHTLVHMISSLNFVCRHYAVLSHPAYKLNIFQVMGVKASAEEGLYSLLKANAGIAVQLD